MSFTSCLEHFSGAFSVFMSTIEKQTRILGPNNASISSYLLNTLVSVHSLLRSSSEGFTFFFLFLFGAFEILYNNKVAVQQCFGLMIFVAISTERAMVSQHTS